MRLKKYLIFAFLATFSWVAGIEAEATAGIVKPVWQQSDKTAANYLKNRHALVGNGCEVNRIVNTVDVGSWATGLNNLVDEDLENVASFPSTVNLGVGATPLASVRDMSNHYAKGTVAGFTVASSSDGKLLGLEVVKCFVIQFYLDGEKVGGPIPVVDGQDVSVLGLSLITLPGSKNVSVDFAAEAPGEFDEICLMKAEGVNLSAVSNVEIKYAFVGTAKQYNLVNTTEGIEAYENDYGRQLTLTAAASDLSNKNALIDEDLTNGAGFGGLLFVGGNASVTAGVDNSDTKKDAPFKAGMTVGFHYKNTSVADLSIGTIKIYLLDKNGKNIQEETISADILSLGLFKGGEGDYAVKAKQDFYGVKIEQISVGADVGALTINYAFVRPEADKPLHQCNICPSADVRICDSSNSYQLDWNKSVSVSWSVKEQPAGANAQVDAYGHVTDMTQLGDYVLLATAQDGCTAEVKIHRGMDDADVIVDSPIYNIEGEDTWQLSTDAHGVTGALLSMSDLDDEENILNAQTADYAQYTGGLAVADNIMIVGVKTKDGSQIAGKKRIGFLVEMQSSGLELNLLQFFSIHAFRNGVESFTKTIDEWNAVSVDLVGNKTIQKIRFSVAVPDGTDFDEFQLWKSGVLNLNISKMNIYYAFANDTDNPSDPFKGIEVISNETTGASLNADATKNIGVISVATETENLTHMIDNDPKFETAFKIVKTVNAGGSVYAVKLGRTYNKNYHVGFVVDNNTYTAGVKAGEWAKMMTYKEGKPTGDMQTDWKVLGANVIGAGDKRLMVMQPTGAYDEVRIEFSSVLSALDFINVYGVFVRSDIDGDGVADAIDDNSCSEELVLDEDAATMLAKGRNYDKARLVLHRSFTRGANISDNIWCSLVLPVNLSGLQVRNAFGNSVRLAEVKGFDVEDSNLLMFKRIDVPANDDAQVIKAGKFYIIETVRTPDISKDEKYQTKEAGLLNGEIYFIDGVDYITDNESESEESYSSADNKHSVTFTGTYFYHDQIPEGVYAFSKGKLYHIINQAKMKGFRFYISEKFAGGAAQAPLMFSVDGQDGSTTGITCITTDMEKGDGAIYDLEGRKVGTKSDFFNVAPGIYIMNGRKIAIK